MNHFTKNLSFTILLNLLVLIPNFILVFVGEDSITATPLKSFVFLVSCFSFVFVGCILIRPKYYFLFLSPIVLIQYLEVIHVFLFKTPTSTGVFIAFLQTNFNESREFLTSQFHFLGIALATLCLYGFLLLRLDTSFYFSLQKKLISAVLFSFFHLLLLSRDFMIIKKTYPSHSMGQTLESIKYSFQVRSNKTFPINSFYRINSYLEYVDEHKNYTQNIKKISFDSIVKDTLQTPETIVLVIGESARSDHFGMNGYKRNTTPNLDTIENILSFKNTYSPSNLTQPSLSFMLSRATPLKKVIMNHEPSFARAFKEQGFQVYWISNQDYEPSHPTNFYSKESDSLILNKLSMDTRKTTDLILVNQFSSLLKITRNYKKRLFIIHTLGSHFRYNYRYTQDFEKFTPCIDNNFRLTSIKPPNKIALINSYDNSILYTDMIVSQCIKELDKNKRKNALVYVSDHGENLFDNDKKHVLHGNTIPTTFELHVPLILWLSASYKKTYRNKYNTLKTNQNKIFSSANLPYLMWELGNLSIYENNNTKNLGSPNYSEPDTIYAFNQKIYKYPVHQLN
jgi:glucan phosphoethanolaminetransferase (alkaline phosphatase superfamily)